MIDFGGATDLENGCWGTVNTRQYRGPEVILQCQPWDEKSDIWSLACILIELYSGSLYFSTHDEVEHLAMIEKSCGPIPLEMAQNSSRQL